ncbi:MAG: hypothetical protein LBI01_05705 [Elusimicrobium sp.]|jgi:hypothetical protein|nr:hypothetical protein [Elusimicrobium sp.]
MNKIKLALALLTLPLFCAAETGKFEERIFIDGNEAAYAEFPSSYVAPRMVRFVMPRDYDKNSKTYPVVYVLGESKNKKIIKSSDAVFIFIQPAPGDEKRENFAKFLTDDLMPYAETNYRISDEPRFRLLAARGVYCDYAADIFALQRKIDNLALLDTSVFNVNFTPRGRIWLTGKKANILGANEKLKAKGFIFGQNMLYNFNEGTLFDTLPLPMIFGVKYLPDNFVLSAAVDMPAIPVAYDGPVEIDAKLNLKNGVLVDYIIDKVTFSNNAYFTWAPAKQAFFIKNGAAKGSYTAKVAFGGKNAAARFKLY